MAAATLIRAVQHRMPTASYATLVEFTQVVEKVAQNWGQNTVGAHGDFLKIMDRAVRSREEWACEAVQCARLSRRAFRS